MARQLPGSNYIGHFFDSTDGSFIWTHNSHPVFRCCLDLPSFRSFHGMPSRLGTCSVSMLTIVLATSKKILRCFATSWSALATAFLLHSLMTYSWSARSVTCCCSLVDIGHTIACTTAIISPVVSVMDRLQDLLQFATGSRRVPVGGFAQLVGFNGGKHLFTLARGAHLKPQSLPTSHACICTLDLPPWDSFKAARCKLLRATEAGGGRFDESTGAAPGGGEDDQE
ncbi:unnamed protein product [Prorocentrum cordatum]|uniref:HECT-type E3 ubiquitin transferase n=1 Tax=Prorocentrum cordatum TaxID=2364126 RepID=A0ABN9WVB2_9DINO|nr:unnamed protein product [Polarella glacialis]